MKIFFYSSKPYEIVAFQQANKTHKLHFSEAQLTSETAKLAKDFDAVCIFVNDNLSAEILTIFASYHIRYVLLRSAGFNHVDLNAAEKLRIKVARVPAYSPHAVAEHTVALLLTLNRKTHKAYNRIREDNFDLNGLIGFDLYKKTIGVIGCGKIGECFIKMMLGFGCNVLAYDPHPSESVKSLPITLTTLETLYKNSDIISLHCPLTEQTAHLINHDTINQMKNNVVILNTGRGKLIDTQAVINGLKRQKIGMLGLDVYEEESTLFFQDHSIDIVQDDIFQRLITFPNVLITGHQGFLTQEALKAIAETTLKNADQFSRKGDCDHLVKLYRS